MRSFVPEYEMVAPANLLEALRLLGEGDWQPFAGGTDLMVLLEAGKLPQKKFVSLWGIAELRGITESEEGVTVGALTTYTDVLRSAAMLREFPLLVQAARETGGVATQNRGTLGGNIVNASPAADSPPALLVYDAELELRSARGSRWVPYAGFHLGYKRTLLGAGEVVSRIRLPRRRSGMREHYRKVGTRKAQAISKVCFAASLQVDADSVRKARLALGSVAPLPLRCTKTENLLERQRVTPELIAEACLLMEEEISPITDIRSTEVYRRRVASNLLAEFLRSL